MAALVVPRSELATRPAFECGERCDRLEGRTRGIETLGAAIEERLIRPIAKVGELLTADAEDEVRRVERRQRCQRHHASVGDVERNQAAGLADMGEAALARFAPAGQKKFVGEDDLGRVLIVDVDAQVHVCPGNGGLQHLDGSDDAVLSVDLDATHLGRAPEHRLEQALDACHPQFVAGEVQLVRACGVERLGPTAVGHGARVTDDVRADGPVRIGTDPPSFDREARQIFLLDRDPHLFADVVGHHDRLQ